jgi:hypothetical protein
MTDKELFKLALDALIWTTGSGDFSEGGQAHDGAKKCLFPAITALKERLAQEKALQALHSKNERLGLYKDAYAEQEPDLIARLRHTASKGVSVWGDLMLEAAKELEILTAERECYASAMDRMLAQPEQEPVARDPLPRACNLAGVDYQTFLKIKAYMPVYDTTPPQRTEQEPVAWFTQARNLVPANEFTEEEAKLYGWNALYLHPPQRTEENT